MKSSTRCSATALQRPSETCSPSRAPAGRAELVRVEQVVRGDSIEFDVSLRETVRGAPAVRHVLARCPIQGDACERELRSATRQVLLGDSPSPGATSPGTNSLAAYRSFAAGAVAFREWRLADADSLFRQAVDVDPRFAEAWQQLASTRWWRGEPPEQWRSALQQAVAVDTALAPRERVRSIGLLALADHRWADACAAFDALLRADSLDYAAWFGRAECLRLNSEVVPDPSSPTGLRFTTSYEAALVSYRRALTLAPGAHRAFGERLFGQMASFFIVDEYHLRVGTAVGSDAFVYYAWPALGGDTLVFLPRPFSELRTTGLSAPPTQLRAVLRNRSLLSALTLEWVQAYPQGAEAHVARASALSLLSEGGQASSNWDQAMEEVRLARRLANDPAMRVEAAVTEARLLVKSGNYAAAAKLADSLAIHTENPDTAVGRRLAAVAALVGRIEKAVEFAKAGAPGLVDYGPGGVRLEFPLPWERPRFRC